MQDSIHFSLEDGLAQFGAKLAAQTNAFIQMDRAEVKINRLMQREESRVQGLLDGT